MIVALAQNSPEAFKHSPSIGRLLGHNLGTHLFTPLSSQRQPSEIVVEHRAGVGDHLARGEVDVEHVDFVVLGIHSAVRGNDQRPVCRSFRAATA